MEAIERAVLYGITNFSGIALIAIMLISRRNTSLKTSEKVYFDSTLYSIGILLFVSSMLWFCECSDSGFVVFINRIMSICYSAVLPLIGMFYVFYCECRMSPENQVSRTKKYVFMLPAILNTVVSLLSVFSGTYFDIVDGIIYCEKCKNKLFYASAENEFLERGLAKPITTLSDSVLAAMRYVISSKPERFLSFNLQEDEQNSFYNACEKFLLNQLERGFYSLDFYKSML